MRVGEEMWHIFCSFRRVWIQNLCNFTSHVFSYLQPWQQKALNCSTNYTAPFVSQAKQEIRLLSARDGIKKHLVSSVLSNPILTPSHVPMWGCAAPQNRLGNSTNDLPGKSQRAAITCSFADVPLLHRAHVWFLSGLPLLFFLPCSHSYFTSITCSFCCLYHPLSSLSLSLSLSLCPWHSVSVSPLACLSASLFLSLPGLPPFLPHTSASFSFTLKYVLVGCVSCRNASSDCILHPQGNNKAGVLLPPPFSSPSFFPFVPQKWGIAAVNTKSRKAKRKIYRKKIDCLFHMLLVCGLCWHRGYSEKTLLMFISHRYKNCTFCRLMPCPRPHWCSAANCANNIYLLIC